MYCLLDVNIVFKVALIRYVITDILFDGESSLNFSPFWNCSTRKIWTKIFINTNADSRP